MLAAKAILLSKTSETLSPV